MIFGTSNHALVGIGHKNDPNAQATISLQRIPSFYVNDDNTGVQDKKVTMAAGAFAEALFFRLNNVYVHRHWRMPKHPSSSELPVILEQMAPLQSMERGTLSEEYRERADGRRQSEGRSLL